MEIDGAHQQYFVALIPDLLFGGRVVIAKAEMKIRDEIGKE